MTAILLVDDDQELMEMLKAYLEREDLQVTVAYEGKGGVAEALTGRHDLLVLDVMMPGMNGLEALRVLRQQSEIPVIMLTARGATLTGWWGWSLAPMTTCLSPARRVNCWRASTQYYVV